MTEIKLGDETCHLPLKTERDAIFDNANYWLADANSEEIAEFLALAVNEAEQLRAKNAELRAKLGGDWIPVDDERKPEVGQVVWMTDLIDGKPYTVARLYLGRFGNQTAAWMLRFEPEPYKTEGGSRDEQE